MNFFFASITALRPPIPKKPLEPSSTTVYSMLSLLVPSWIAASMIASLTVFAVTRIESITVSPPYFFFACFSLYCCTICALDARLPGFAFAVLL